jgi:hypothetical protein
MATRIRTAMAWLGLVTLLSAVGPFDCNGPPEDATQSAQQEQPPRPDDKRVNEGAMGRKNATETAARAADSPTEERKP